jgi:hypothetical protein
MALVTLAGLAQKVHPAVSEEVFQFVGEVLLQVFESIVGAACPAVPVNLPSCPNQTQIIFTLGTLHRSLFVSGDDHSFLKNLPSKAL